MFVLGVVGLWLLVLICWEGDNLGFAKVHVFTVICHKQAPFVCTDGLVGLQVASKSARARCGWVVVVSVEFLRGGEFGIPKSLCLHCQLPPAGPFGGTYGLIGLLVSFICVRARCGWAVVVSAEFSGGGEFGICKSVGLHCQLPPSAPTWMYTWIGWIAN